MASVMENIVNSPSIQKECRKLGYEQVKKFSWEKMADDTLKIYIDILPKKPETEKITITLTK